MMEVNVFTDRRVIWVWNRQYAAVSTMKYTENC